MLHYHGTGEIAEKIIQGNNIHELQGMDYTIRKYIKGMAVSDKKYLTQLI